MSMLLRRRPASASVAHGAARAAAVTPSMSLSVYPHTCAAFSSSSSSSMSGKTLNLTPMASPLLLVLHPDRLVRRAPALAAHNEQALKQLNVFLELAARGCNNDAYGARRQVLALAAEQHNDPSAPLRFPLQFHVGGDANDFQEREYVIQVPSQLVKRTLAHSASSSTSRSATNAPFARSWQRTTKRILQDLFHLAAIPLEATSLESWLADDAGDPDALESDGVRVGSHNRRQHREHLEFDKTFHAMLTREKNIVHTTTTGLEDGPTTQHAVLTSLIQERLVLPKLQDSEARRNVFSWIAGFLLINFMELRLHSLVWNKVTLLVTNDTSVTDPDVLWDPEKPELGMGVLIPVGIDPLQLLDYLYEQVDELDRALAARGADAHGERKIRKPKAKGKSSQRPSHFYEKELDAILRRR